MKVALLLPGYLDSPDYLHLLTFEKRLLQLGYVVERLDPCHVWATGVTADYTVTAILNQVKDRIDTYEKQSADEIVLIGHSLGGFISILAGARFPKISRIVALCPPASLENLGKKWQGQPVRVSTRNLPPDQDESRQFEVPLSFVTDAQLYSVLDEIKQITQPLMICICMKDVSVPPQETELLVANAIHPYVVRMDELGHDFRHSEVESEAVMDQIETFLKQ